MESFHKAIILEDHQETRQVLSEIITGILPKVTIYEAASLRQARQHLYEQKKFDLALIDISLPDGDGTIFVSELIEHSSRCYAVMCTIYDDDQHLFKALRAGANGYLVKEHSKQELSNMLHGILDGRPPLSPGVAQHILDSFHQPQQNDFDLTAREIEVLTLLAKGFNRKEIAGYIELKTNTVSWYIKQVYRKLDVHTRAEATLEASRLGLVR